jgi:hypothetical protein
VNSYASTIQRFICSPWGLDVPGLDGRHVGICNPASENKKNPKNLDQLAESTAALATDDLEPECANAGP